MDDFLLQSSEKNNKELKSLGGQLDMLLQAISKSKDLNVQIEVNGAVIKDLKLSDEQENS